jgi:hypothetical protein
MRFISQYPGYGIQIRQQRVRPMGDGTSQVLVEPLYVKFKSVDEGGMLYEKERYAAAQHFDFHGSQQYEDEATPVEPQHRLSVLDTVEMAAEKQWSPEDVAEIEQTLSRKAVSTPQAVYQVVGTPVDPPYPNYDVFDGEAEQLVLRLVEDGFELQQVLFYETSFGPKRPDVIAALERGIEAIKELTVPA